MSIASLREQLAREGFRGHQFLSLDASIPPAMEGYVLIHDDGRWRIQYHQRGELREIAVLSSEEEACERMYGLLSADRFYTDPRTPP